MIFNRTLLLYILFLFACSSINRIPRYYSKSNFEYEQVLKNYENVPIIEEMEFDNYIKNLVSFNNYKISDSITSTGSIICQPLINSEGQLESILVLKSINSYLDSLALEALKSSSFKMLKNKNGNFSSYSFKVDYGFYNGVPFIPYVNNKPYRGNHIEISRLLKEKNDSIKYDIKDSKNNIKDVTSGSLSLSNYDWNWSPYILEMKKKLHKVWQPPIDYTRLGLIFGYTIIKFDISREGELLSLDLVKHKGNESLLNSSIDAIKSLFPFKALPNDFKDSVLKIEVKLFYPNLRNNNY